VAPDDDDEAARERLERTIYSDRDPARREAAQAQLLQLVADQERAHGSPHPAVDGEGSITAARNPEQHAASGDDSTAVLSRRRVPLSAVVILAIAAAAIGFGIGAALVGFGIWPPDPTADDSTASRPLDPVTLFASLPDQRPEDLPPVTVASLRVSTLDWRLIGSTGRGGGVAYDIYAGLNDQDEACVLVVNQADEPVLGQCLDEGEHTGDGYTFSWFDGDQNEIVYHWSSDGSSANFSPIKPANSSSTPTSAP
jgi:hypothetical protein